MKRSQVSVFAILGLVIIIIALIFLAGRKPGIDDYSKDVKDFQLAKESFADYSNKCLKLSTEKSLYRYGYGYVHEQMEYYIKKYFFRCMDNFNEFRNQGYDFSYDEPQLNLTIGETKVESVLVLNMEMSKGEQKALFERFESRFDRPEVTIDGKWIFRGILYKYEETKDPRPMQVFTAKIDLEDPTVSFFVTPKIAPDVMTTSRFLSNYNLQLAVNGGGFDIGATNEVNGYSMSDGVVYSAENITPGLTVYVDKNSMVSLEQESGEAVHAITGFNRVIENYRPNDRLYKDNPLHKEGYDTIRARTAMGIDKDDYWLLILVVNEGTSKSAGANLMDLAEIFMRYNTFRAFNMDGGGSTTLVIEEGDSYKILNSPSGGGERPVANHFGVYAEELN
jgi:exopolysaccharide biosynthesis protein